MSHDRQAGARPGECYYSIKLCTTYHSSLSHHKNKVIKILLIKLQSKQSHAFTGKHLLWVCQYLSIHANNIDN